MIKVTHIIYDFNFGGMSRLLYDLVSLQVKNDFIEPKILVIKNVGEFKSDFESLDIKIVSLNVKNNYFFKNKHIKDTLSCYNTSDLIHFHNFHPYLCFIASLTKNKILYTEHGIFGFGRRTGLKDNIMYSFRKIYYKNYVDSIICVSESTKKFLQDEWGITKNNVKVILNGVNNDFIPSKEKVKEIRSKFENRFIIGIAARLAGVKRIDLLIKSFKIFSDEYTDSVLLIVGEGPDKNILENYVKQNKINNVYFIGFKSNIFDYQSAFDISVLPSHNESFGLVAVESYLAGKPILVFRDGGGLTEIVSRYDKNDIVDSIASLVKRLKYHFHNKTKTKTKNFNKITSYFSSRRMEKEYFLEYKSILNQKNYN